MVCLLKRSEVSFGRSRMSRIREKITEGRERREEKERQGGMARTQKDLGSRGRMCGPGRKDPCGEC